MAHDAKLWHAWPRICEVVLPWRLELIDNERKETREEMEARMMTLENTITGLMARPRETSMDETSETTPTETQAGNIQYSSNPNALPINKKWNTFKEPTYSTPPYSTIEAQQMIEQELRQGEKLSKQKREAFHAALGSLSDSLAISQNDPTTALFDSYSAHVEAQRMEVAKYPEIETVKWMLTRECHLTSTNVSERLLTTCSRTSREPECMVFGRKLPPT